jgi:hypothetical protein
MTTWVILEAVFVVIVLSYGYMWKGPPRMNLAPKKLARYRFATRLALFWAVLIFVRLVTQTYK